LTFWEVDILGVDTSGVDILGVDILGGTCTISSQCRAFRDGRVCWLKLAMRAAAC